MCLVMEVVFWILGSDDSGMVSCCFKGYGKET